jgi:hypothetical protein
MTEVNNVGGCLELKDGGRRAFITRLNDNSIVIEIDEWNESAKIYCDQSGLKRVLSYFLADKELLKVCKGCGHLSTDEIKPPPGMLPG